jgi:tetratricopeptide (TPR) repeat protein
MMRFRGSARPHAARLLVALALCAPPVSAHAGTISFQITSTVDTATGVELTLEIKNTGDEAARDVVPTAVLGEDSVAGKRVSVVGPGSSQQWRVRVRDQPLPTGAYVLIAKLRYEDANGYPFEVLAAAPFTAATDRRKPVVGSLELPQLRGRTSADAAVVLRVPGERGRRFEVRIVLPSGVAVDRVVHRVTADEGGRVRVPVRIRNASLLEGSSVNAFALVTSLDEDPPQTDAVRGVVRVGQPPALFTTQTFLSMLAALIVYLLALEIISGRHGSGDEAAPSAWARLADHALALAPSLFLLTQYPWDALLAPTTAAGGDMASLYYPTKLLAEEIMPRWQLTGWTMGNYAGFPVLHFYSTLPFAAIVLLGKVFPMQQTFKIVTLAGPTLLPLAAGYLFRRLGYGRGAAAVAAVSVLPFLLQQGNSMWGGNIPSVLAGEFCHSIGLTLSVVFLGALHRTVTEKRSWVLPALLLAVIGLCHTFAFLAAVWYSLFFVWPRRGVSDRATPVIAVYLVAFLLLCFWGLPLPSRLVFTSEWSMIWRIKEWTEVLPQALWPAGIVAGINVAWMLLSSIAAALAGRGWRPPEPATGAWTLAKPFVVERQGLLIFVIGGGLLLYFLAPAIGFPDIRFIPVSQLFLSLLAADFVIWLGALVFRHREAFAACLVAGGLAYAYSHLGYIPSWLNWNYTGYEGKATWGLFKSINDHVRGDLNDTRVVFEHSQAHNRFGSSRAFENLPLFSGRSTLEGVFHQASPNSPFIFYLQSEASERGSGPFPQYTYTRLDPAKALPHLRLFNATDIIAVSEAAKKAYDEDPAFEKTFESGAYAVFHAASAGTGYVVAARNQPILYDGPNWKLEFYRWYKHYDLLDVPLVPAEMIDADAARRFELRTDSLTRLERRPYDGDCEIVSELEQYAIRFRTSCPGRPHIVKVSYFPRWRATDGSPVMLVSPAFMMVVPRGEYFELTYGRNAIDWLGLFISIVGLAILIVCSLSRPTAEALARNIARPLSPLIKAFERFPKTLTILLLTAAIGGGWATRVALRKPDNEYARAQDAYKARDFTNAIRLLEHWTSTDRDTFKQATALYQLGVSYSELGDYAASALAHERLRFEFPNVDYGAGTLFHLANSYASLGVPERAREYAHLLETEHPETSWMERLRREHPAVFQ